ncbi:MAG: ATP phosphoribosyltransferase regulatory subunit [Nitrospinae bacterium]|nr:ATP phosphoribosyltransferase regulatory subunit [Nitrospinota bacterium]
MKTVKGFRTYLFEESARKRWVERRLIDLFLRWGFREIIPPPVEYDNSVGTKNSASDDSKRFRFTEPGSGKILALRSDITPQIIRTASVYMKEMPRPLRLCYTGSVFRYAEPRSGKQQEIFQGGVELIGLDSPEADAEMITIAAQVFKEIGLEGFKMTVSQIDFFRGIVADTSLSDEEITSLKEMIVKKDVAAIGDFLAGRDMDDNAKKNILAIPNLFGGQEVIAKARALRLNETSLKALENLENVINILNKYGVEDSIMIDLGEISGLGYYTGISFDGFVKGVGYEVCGGGRYDKLPGAYGDASPAVGFAVDIGAVLEVMDRGNIPFENGKVSYIIIDSGKDRMGIELAKAIRAKGKSAARDIIKRDKKESLNYARKMNIDKGLIIGTDGLEKDELIEVDLESGVERKLKIEEFLCR